MRGIRNIRLWICKKYIIYAGKIQSKFIKYVGAVKIPLLFIKNIIYQDDKIVDF